MNRRTSTVEKIMYTLAGVIISSLLWMMYTTVVLASETTDLTEMAGCAQGQNLQNRFTNGTATYRVMFADGEVIAVECISQK